MKLRRFIMLILFVGVVAAVFSPSSLNLAYSSQGTFTNSQWGLSNFVSTLNHAGYKVEIANTTQQELTYAENKGSVLFIIGPDTPLSVSESRTIYSDYQNGGLSLVLAEGNSTNTAQLLSYFHANVTGALITDPSSSFKDQSVFAVELQLGGTTTNGVVNGASPILLTVSSLSPVATSSFLSTDSKNSTAGGRTVVAATANTIGPRVLLLSDSSPFTNCMLGKCAGVNDTHFVNSIVSWASSGNKSSLIIIDGSHYASTTSPIGFGVPVGWIVIVLLQFALSSFGSASSLGVLSSLGGGFNLFGIFIPIALIKLALGLLLLWFVLGRVKAWFATEKVVKDDQPLPNIERIVVSESKERTDFLSLSRNKSFYVATLVQLYEVIDDVVKMELGEGVNSVTPQKLGARMSKEKLESSMKLLNEVSKIYAYAVERKRFFFPPVLSWKRKAAFLTKQAESFLNDLGMTMAGEGGGKQIEYALKR